MTQNSNVIPLKCPKSEEYQAKIFRSVLEKHSFVVSATLDGWVELALHRKDGTNNRTYQFTRDDARRLIAALNGSIQDITENCRFENDTRLYDEGSRP